MDFSEELFADSLQKLGARVALITAEGNEVTYEDLVRRAEDIVHGWGHERRLVVIEAANEVEPIAAYVGALRHRHAVIILAPGSDETNRRILDTYRPDIIFKHGPEGWRSFATGNADRPPLHGELAVLLSTSGSTGDPKLVRLSRKNIGTNAEAIRQYLTLRDDRAITSLPWHYSYGLSVVNSYLASGSTLLLTENSVVDPQFWDFFRAHGGTSLAGVPHTYELLERVGFRRTPPPPSLRYMTVAGGRLDPPLVKEYADWTGAKGVAFFVMYGQTEAAPRMAYLPPDLASEHPGSIGIPIPGGSFRLISEEGKEISEPDVAGELVYGGPNVMMGYARTREDLSRGHEVAELHTGDLACRTAQGLYRIVGRASRFSKIFGLRINLDDVEQHLAAEGVAARASGNDTVIAVCALGDVRTDELEFQLARRFGLNRSAFIVYVAHDYPLLPNGKIDNRSILAQGLRIAEARKPIGPVEPSSPGATGIRADLGRMFGREVGPQDSFVTLGGDSLSFIQASLIIEERLGFLPDDWERLPISQLEPMQQKPSTASADSDGGSSTRSEIVLRAVAILGVVITHADLYSMAGGAFLLIVFAGYAFARFQRDRLWSGRVFQAFTPFLLRILVPYYLVLAAYAVARGGIDPQHWFLIANFYPEIQSGGGILPFYWFIDNLTQIVILFSLLFLVPPLRRILGDRPFGAGLTLLGISFAVSIATPVALRGFDLHMLETGWFFVRTPMFTFYMFVFGWCLFFASEKWQRHLLTGAALITFSTVQIESYTIWLVGGALIAIWAPSIVVIPPVRKIASVIASSSFYIFIAHMIPIYIALFVIGIDNVYAKFAVVLVAVSLGIIVSSVVRRGEVMMRRAFRHIQQMHPRSRNP